VASQPLNWTRVRFAYFIQSACDRASTKFTMTHSPKMEVASGVSSKSSSSNFKADDRLYEQHVRKNNEKLLNPIPWTLVFETSLQRPCFRKCETTLQNPGPTLPVTVMIVTVKVWKVVRGSIWNSLYLSNVDSYRVEPDHT